MTMHTLRQGLQQACHKHDWCMLVLCWMKRRGRTVRNVRQQTDMAQPALCAHMQHWQACCVADVPPVTAEVLERGKTNTVQLSNHMLEGRDSWLKWHRYYAQTLSPKIEQVCLNVKSLPFRLMSFNEFVLCTKWASCQVALTGLMQGPQD